MAHYIDDITYNKSNEKEVASTLDVLKRSMCFRGWEINLKKIEKLS